MRLSGSRSAFSLYDALAIVSVVILITVLVVPAISLTRCRGAPQMKDSSQIRGIHQAMIQWANSNKERFPLPSDIDKDGFTLDVGQRDSPANAQLLDSTGNIFSLLIWNGLIPTQLCVSPSEAGPIDAFANYQDLAPDSAADPAKALWDPSFRGHPGDPVLGPRESACVAHFSYAHLIPFGRRRDTIWRDSASSSHTVLANRGPAYEPLGTGDSLEWRLVPRTSAGSTFAKPLGVDSNTLLIHGNRNTWEGNVAYNDNRVIFETEPAPEGLIFTFSGLSARAPTKSDNLFVNENDVTRMPDSDRLGFGSPANDNLNIYLRAFGRTILRGGTSDRPSFDIVPFYD